MSDPASLHLDIGSDPCGLACVRDQVHDWLVATGWLDPAVSEIVMAVDEALTNVIRHGYSGETGHRIVLHIDPIASPDLGDGIRVLIRDFGKQVDPTCICGRDLDDVRPGGLGVHIIQALMDSVEYSRAGGGGMQLVMQRHRHRPPKPGDRQAGSL